MSYILDIMENGEYTLYEASIHPAAYLAPIAVVLLTLWPARLSRLSSTELALTNKRVLGKVGRVRQKVIAVPANKIDVVRVNRGLMGLICGYGTVTIIPRDGDKVVFKGISRPKVIQDKIEEAMEFAILGRRLPRGDEELIVDLTKKKPLLPPKTEATPVAKPEPKPEVKPEPKPEVKPEPKSEAKPESKPAVVLPKQYKDPNAW